MAPQKRIFVLLFAFTLCLKSVCSQSILLFVSHEQTYYTEYIVMKEALEASGYVVDVRSSIDDAASIYMIAEGGDVIPTIVGVANALPGSTYTQFTEQFQNMFGGSWDSSNDATPSSINVNGTIQDVVDMTLYDALVIVGGTGALDYRVDGNYSAQGTVSAEDVEAAAEKLNQLALDALLNGKPVMAQCHGASLAAYWRIPSTSGPGEEALGFSLLKENYSTGYPETETAPTLLALDINYREDDRVTISSPHSSFMDEGNGQHKIITTRDWYPQTVAFAARSLLNIIETSPSKEELETPISVLIIHGGAIDPGNCGPANRINDIPCNFGVGPDLPADYTDIENLLNATSANDAYSFTLSELNITGVSLPFDSNNQSEIETYLSQFDVVIFYKHWSTGITAALENALVSFADNGGGVVGLHHGLYNDIDGPRNKDILVSQLFGAESPASGWSSNLTNYNVYNTNYGHFVSTYGITLVDDAQLAPAAWSTNGLITAANASYSTYPVFSVYDEIYNNMVFDESAVFGRGVNEITPLFSNDQLPSSQSHTTGFVKLFDPSGDASIGRVVYFEIGERKENSNINHLYGQVIRNAVAWAAPKNNIVLGVNLSSFQANVRNNTVEVEWQTVSEINNEYFELFRSKDGQNWNLIQEIDGAGDSINKITYSYIDKDPHLGISFYRLRQTDYDGTITNFQVASVYVPYVDDLRIYPNPTTGVVNIKGNCESIILKSVGGNTLLTFKSTNSIDLSHMPTGTYILQIYNGKKTINRLILKE